MLKYPPIYTEETKCQDCYKCLRSCPVKAIKVENKCATIIRDNCIACGHCVEVCPSGAKKVRSDLRFARKTLEQRARVIASLDPSFVNEFSAVQPAQLIAALRELGFFGVSETALGAQQVSAHAAAALGTAKQKIMLSSACPTAVEFIRKYHPEYAGKVTNLMSPLLTHAKMLRRTYGDEIGIVSIGPCIAAKREADERADLVDVALTFEELHDWLKERAISPETMNPGPDDRFIPHEAREGAIYAIAGGMAAGIKARGADDMSFISISGLRRIERALPGLEGWTPNDNVFVELLACPEGCINGPTARRLEGTVRKRYEVLHYAKACDVMEEEPLFPINELLPTSLPEQPVFSEVQIHEALATVGKHSPADERNCGGCGYESCKQLAAALLAGKAERTMCVTYMRQLAQKKTNALMSKMPSAAVILDDQLRIIDANKKFQAMFDHAPADGQPPDSFEGLYLGEIIPIVPFCHMFQRVLSTGQDALERDFRLRGTIMHVTIFTIDPHAVVGAILQDITSSRLKKEQIISRAQEVIQKNLKTVQEIAFLLGENAAQSEITLNSIVESFAPGDVDDETGEEDDAK
jgi:iron only hydrogenase large subunit-like protein